MEFTKIAGTEISSSRIGLGTWAMGGWLWGGSGPRGVRQDHIQGVRRGREPDRHRSRLRLRPFRGDCRRGGFPERHEGRTGHRHQGGTRMGEGRDIQKFPSRENTRGGRRFAPKTRRGPYRRLPGALAGPSRPCGGDGGRHGRPRKERKDKGGRREQLFGRADGGFPLRLPAQREPASLQSFRKGNRGRRAPRGVGKTG